MPADSQPHVFVALYEGPTIGQARIIAASANPELVALATKQMLQSHEQKHTTSQCVNEIHDALDKGQRAALQAIESQLRVSGK